MVYIWFKGSKTDKITIIRINITTYSYVCTIMKYTLLMIQMYVCEAMEVHTRKYI